MRISFDNWEILLLEVVETTTFLLLLHLEWIELSVAVW
jgi:hypothetical protein